MSTTPTPPKPTPRSKAEHIRDCAQQLATAIDKHLGPGDRASLRRPDLMSAPAFWRLFAQFVVSSEHLPSHSSADEQAWACIIRALAIAHPVHRRSSRPGDAGRALSEAGYSPARLTRLLRADGERLATEIVACTRFLASKKQNADVATLAPLVFTAPDHHDSTRRALASSFYLHQSTDSSSGKPS